MKTDHSRTLPRAYVSGLPGLAAGLLSSILLVACSSMQEPADRHLPIAKGTVTAGRAPTAAAPVLPAAVTPRLPDKPAELPPAVADAKAPAPLPDAVPRVERIPQRAPNLPYVVRGDPYEPISSDVPMIETGLASWYGEPFHGRRTANGEVYDMDAMTAAHRTMPLPSYALVRNKRNGRQIVVRVNDRGPYKYEGRVIDVSRAAARKLGFTGLADVEVRRLTHHEIRTGSWKHTARKVASAEQAR